MLQTRCSILVWSSAAKSITTNPDEIAVDRGNTQTKLPTTGFCSHRMWSGDKRELGGSIGDVFGLNSLLLEGGIRVERR